MQRFLSSQAIALLFAATAMAAEPITVRLLKERPQSGHFVETRQGFMVEYEDRIPGTSVTFRMVPVPGKLSASKKEAIKPFWIGKYELTVAEYREYMKLHDVFQHLEARKLRAINDDNEIDAVTAPTPIYEPAFRSQLVVDAEFQDGKLAPATSMTRFAARQYTKWLSLIGTKQYRLPTEIEWIHACRAGSKSSWSFGADASKASEYCCFDAEGPLPIGSKKPNAWGIHDMHGNVSEWVLAKSLLRDSTSATDARDYDMHREMILKGGDFTKSIADCRVTMRERSSEELWDEDPDVPQSPTWLASDESLAVGFRIISPLQPMPRQEIEKYWSPDSKSLISDVETLKLSGRGVDGLVDKTLPSIVEEVHSQQ